MSPLMPIPSNILKLKQIIEKAMMIALKDPPSTGTNKGFAINKIINANITNININIS